MNFNHAAVYGSRKYCENIVGWLHNRGRISHKVFESFLVLI